jgi:hypothetical protein
VRLTGDLVLAADVSNWLRPGAATSPERLFCHVYGQGKGQAQMIPGWPYSPGPGRPPGSKNRHPAPRHDVGKTTKRELTLMAHRERAG